MRQRDERKRQEAADRAAEAQASKRRAIEQALRRKVAAPRRAPPSHCATCAHAHAPVPIAPMRPRAHAVAPVVHITHVPWCGVRRPSPARRGGYFRAEEEDLALLKTLSAQRAREEKDRATEADRAAAEARAAAQAEE
eukprot:3501494-Prymnesium_polylepis.1